MLRDATAEERNEIDKYLQLDEEYLYSLIPPHLESDIFYDFNGQIEAGKKAFTAMETTIQTRLCDDWELCNKIDDPHLADITNLVVVIGDVLSTTVSGLPPFLVASLLVKTGLRKFCGCQVDED